MDKNLYSAEREMLRLLLRSMRQEAGLRQVDVAERLGEPQSFVSKYERGERRLDVIELRAVCEAIETTLGGFVARLEEELER